ncbi:protein unc-45 homolog B-like isoform X2 [Temnothorax nylanderi]|uniref:protein unc-45 homolog B-like isoform X2 n=1 Tax=Temnothorax nylanderi TaxID=102681 RepID=UPI003A890A6A
MLDQAFFIYASEKERQIAMKNLLVFARDQIGAEEIFKKEGVSKIAQLVKVEKNEEILCSAIRIVGELCENNISRTESVTKFVGLRWCLEIMNSTSIQRVNASQYCLQNILNTYSGMNNKPDLKPDDALCAAHKEEIDTILSCLLNNVTSRTITGLARDATIQLIMRNIHCVTKLDWAKRFVELRGVQRLMEVASEMEEYKYKSSMDITSSTQTITSVCLEMVRVVVAITALLLGPLDVGNAVVAKEGILEMILVMAGTDDVLQQTVALECIVAAMTGKDKVDAIINQGVNILKKLCQSKDDSIRVRALAAFCKMGNSGDSDTSTRPFADGVTKELTEACRRLLINPKNEKNMREWECIESLSYLTFNTRVKEKLIEDKKAIFMLIEIAKTGDQSVLFSVLTTLVNLCNAYHEHECCLRMSDAYHEPKMMELTAFVKYHFPEESELVKDDFVGRLWALVAANVISVLVNLAKTDSHNCKELIARVLNAICILEGVRDLVVNKGGTEALLSLALDGTVEGKKQALLALVRLALTKGPEVIFPGQLLTEFVQPIVNLLNPECSVNDNYQTLTVLCNIAEVNVSMGEHIFKEGIFQKIEGFRCKKDYFLRLASANLINILILSPKVAIQYFEQDNSRVEYLMLLYEDENQDIKFAAAAALVKLTVANKEACKEVFDLDWPYFLRSLLTSPSNDIQEMGVIFVISMITSVEDFAAKLIETSIMELLRVLRNKNSTVQNENIKELTSIALEAVAEQSSKKALSVRECDLLNRLQIKYMNVLKTLHP